MSKKKQRVKKHSALDITVKSGTMTTGQQFIQTAKKTTFWKQMKEIDETSGKTLRANFMELVYGTNKPFETYDLMFKAYCTALGLKASKWEEINWLDGTSDINAITE